MFLVQILSICYISYANYILAKQKNEFLFFLFFGSAFFLQKKRTSKINLKNLNSHTFDKIFV